MSTSILRDTYTLQQVQQLALDLEDTQARLMGAQHEVCALSDHLAACKYQLDNARACALVEGVEGKNEAQREAALRLSLGELYQAIHETELKLSRAKLELTFAHLEWDTLRYRLRAYETATQLIGGRA